jgi:hypothetical protein
LAYWIMSLDWSITVRASRVFPLSCKINRIYRKTVISAFFLILNIFYCLDNQSPLPQEFKFLFQNLHLELAFINKSKEYRTNILTIPNSVIRHSTKH